MFQLAVIAILSAATGLTVWGVDRRRSAYGILVLPAVAVTGALLTWIALVLAAVSYTPGIDWLAWAAPIGAGAVAGVVTALLLGPRRSGADLERLNAALRA